MHVFNAAVCFDYLEQTKNLGQNDQPYWHLSQLQSVLGVEDWSAFIDSALGHIQYLSKMANVDVEDHFQQIDTVNQEDRAIKEWQLSRYGAYLLAQHQLTQGGGLSAYAYFGQQTPNIENYHYRMNLGERLQAVHGLKHVQALLVDMMAFYLGSNQSYSFMDNKGDHALMGGTVSSVRDRWNLPNDKPLACFLPSVLVHAKAHVISMTLFKFKQEQSIKESQVIRYHVDHSIAVRKNLLAMDIEPENMPMLDDVSQLMQYLQYES